MKKIVLGVSFLLASAGAQAAPKQVALGANASLGGTRVLAPDSPWNAPIDHVPVDPSSAKYIASIGADLQLHPDFGTLWQGAPWGIPYVVVAGDTLRSPVRFDYADESDDVLYPIPPNPPIEGAIPGKGVRAEGDRHLIVIDRDNDKLYELLEAKLVNGTWQAASGAVFALFGDTQRPRGWTSADAAGLPIFPGLIRYDEVVEQGKIEHALRFTAKKTARAYLAPASHWASRDTNPDLPPMGLRLRLKATVDANKFPAKIRPIIVALKRYGMYLADNGGPLFLSGAPDPRWNDAEIATLKQLRGRDFEVVRTGHIIAPEK